MAKAIQFRGTFEILNEPEGYCLIKLTHGSFIVTARGENMAFTLAVGMQVHLQVAYVDKGGNPARVDGPVAWATSDALIAEVVVDATDSTKALVRAVDNVGLAQVTVTADADLGEGVHSIITLLDVEAVAGAVVRENLPPVGPGA